MSSIVARAARARHWLSTPFRDHEIFIRTGGQVRFLRLSARAQRLAATAAGALVVGLVGTTATALVVQALDADERAAVAAEKARVAASEARVAAYKDRIAEVAADLDARQGKLEGLVTRHFGDAPVEVDGDAAAVPAKSDEMSALPPEARALSAIDARQSRLAAALAASAEQRATRAGAAIARLGFSPDAVLRNAARGQGGPFIPAPRASLAQGEGSLARLERALHRMEVLERTLVAMPSGRPATITEMSSGFGYRSDPFTGAAALHSGVDFRGPIGTPILAASPGRVVFAGSRGGYGTTIEVDHGQGIVTRYAHLSGIDVGIGETVAAGERIGRMGSTGRSTGSHLHFEVRVNGAAVDPRRFLEANKDVLETKAVARDRVGLLAARGTAPRG